jgi:hypothetical protein
MTAGNNATIRELKRHDFRRRFHTANQLLICLAVFPVVRLPSMEQTKIFG